MATTFPGGPWDTRSPETAAPWSTQGGRVGRPVPWGHRRETGTVKWGVNRSTSRGGVLNGLSPWASGPLSCSLLRVNNGSQMRFTLWRLQLSALTVSPVFRWGSTISRALFLSGTVWGAGFRYLGLLITLKRTNDLNYFSLCELNLFNTWVSQFELNYWNKLPFLLIYWDAPVYQGRYLRWYLSEKDILWILH